MRYTLRTYGISMQCCFKLRLLVSSETDYGGLIMRYHQFFAVYRMIIVWVIITRVLWSRCSSIPHPHWSLRWRHNEHDGVSNHQPHGCLLNRLFRRKSKKPSKLRVTGLCEGNSPVTSEFPAQMASNAENASICWRHHDAGLADPGLRLNIKTVFLRSGDSHVKDKTVARPSYSLTWGSLYWYIDDPPPPPPPPPPHTHTHRGETHLVLKSREISFVHNLLLGQIV